jgi:hypothetical protein
MSNLISLRRGILAADIAALLEGKRPSGNWTDAAGETFFGMTGLQAARTAPDLAKWERKTQAGTLALAGWLGGDFRLALRAYAMALDLRELAMTGESGRRAAQFDTCDRRFPHLFFLLNPEEDFEAAVAARTAANRRNWSADAGEAAAAALPGFEESVSLPQAAEIMLKPVAVVW